jgi:hypothetical protein
MNEQAQNYPEYEDPTPAWTPRWLPVQFLDRTKDDTYLVRVENGAGRSYIDKAYFADDEGVWYEGNASRNEFNGIQFDKTERGPWRVTAFAPWPLATEIRVDHASNCATSCTPAFPAGACDCGAYSAVAA